MKPYYQQDGITIYHGDALEVMPALEPVDCVIADPPYGETSLEWDKPVAGWLQRISLKPSGSLWCFGSFKSFMAQCLAFRDWEMVQEIIWEKHNGSNMQADRFKRVHELAVQFYPKWHRWEEVYKSPVYTFDAVKKKVRRNQNPKHWGDINAPVSSYETEDGGPRLMRSVIYARSCHGYADHPTQKPIAILWPLVEYSCPAGGLILDPFMGAGSSLVAAQQSGRQAIGIELEEKYCEEAVKRLAQRPLLAG